MENGLVTDHAREKKKKETQGWRERDQRFKLREKFHAKVRRRAWLSNARHFFGPPEKSRCWLCRVQEQETIGEDEAEENDDDDNDDDDEEENDEENDEWVQDFQVEPIKRRNDRKKTLSRQERYVKLVKAALHGSWKAQEYLGDECTNHGDYDEICKDPIIAAKWYRDRVKTTSPMFDQSKWSKVALCPLATNTCVVTAYSIATTPWALEDDETDATAPHVEKVKDKENKGTMHQICGTMPMNSKFRSTYEETYLKLRIAGDLTKEGVTLAAMKGLERKGSFFRAVDIPHGNIGDDQWKELENYLQQSNTARAIIGIGTHARCVLWKPQSHIWIALDVKVRNQTPNIEQYQCRTIQGLFEESTTFEAVTYDIQNGICEPPVLQWKSLQKRFGMYEDGLSEDGETGDSDEDENQAEGEILAQTWLKDEGEDVEASGIDKEERSIETAVVYADGPSSGSHTEGTMGVSPGGWIKNDSFQRSPLEGSTRIIATSLGGGVTPWTRGGKERKGSRLRSMTNLITDNKADLVLGVEGHLKGNAAYDIATYAGQVGCYATSAPSSRMMARVLGEETEGGQTDPAAGIVAVMSRQMHASLRRTEKSVSGRLLHLIFGDGANPKDDKSPVHVIAAYGLSGQNKKSGARELESHCH